MSMMPGITASAEMPNGQYIDAASARGSAATTTVTVTVPGGVLDNDILVAFCFGGNEADTIAASTGSWNSRLDDGASANRITIYTRKASSEPTPGSGTWTFTKTGTAGTWKILVAVIRGIAEAPTQTPTFARTTTGAPNPSLTTGVVGGFPLGFHGQEVAGVSYSPSTGWNGIGSWSQRYIDNTLTPSSAVFSTSPSAYYNGSDDNTAGPLSGNNNAQCCVRIMFQVV